MNREIKFRAWEFDNNGGKLVYGYESFIGEALEKGYQLMQFTGLHDKNGKEIYEGDIIDDGMHSNIIVSWCDELSSFVLTRKGWAFRHWFGESCDPCKVEIIGNIHQNPELL
jgi:hypothetical protein